MTAARWAQQELLDHYADTRLHVYAVWFNMYPGDARERWPSTLLTDRRVVSYWDPARATGTRYLMSLPLIMARRAPATLPPSADAMWDAYFVYAPGNRWQDPVPVPISWGYPIMATRDQLLDAVKKLTTK